MNWHNAYGWRRGARVALALLFAALLSGCWHKEPEQKEKQKTTFGTISVDSPEVYTRERLVNDRFRQEAWLLERLKQADTVSFGLQGNISTQITDRLDAALKLVITAPGAVPAAAPAGKGNAAQPANKEKTQQSKTISDNSRGPLHFSPVQEFRDYLAYLEEIRNEIIETQLDDRHDLDGNTLYRLKFDATIIPGDNTTAWARIDAKLFNPNFQFGPSRDDQTPIQQVIAKPPNATTDLGARSESAVSVERENRGLVAGEIKAPPTPVEQEREPGAVIKAQRKIYQNWIKSLHQRVNNDLRDKMQGRSKMKKAETNDILVLTRKHYEHRISDQEDKMRLTKASTLREAAEVLIDTGHVSALDAEEAVLIIIAESLLDIHGRKEVHKKEKFLDLEKYIRFRVKNEEGKIGIDVIPYKEILYLKPKDFKETDKLYHDELGCSPPYNVTEIEGKDYYYCGSTEYYERYINNLLSFGKLQFAFYDSNGDSKKRAERKMQDTWLEIEFGLQNFIKEFPRESKAYAYVVTPKESAQRLSNLANFLTSRSLAGAAGAQAAVAQVSAETKWQKEIVTRAEILERRPLIVGLAKHSGEDYAEFGWLIGPRMVTATDQKITFRQVPSSQTLSAILSVPAWWRQARVEIRANWLDENGRKFISANDNGKEVVVFEIRLPGDLGVMTELLQRKTQRTGPLVYSNFMPPVLLELDKKASVLIPGRNLWRSTVVTIGSNKSNRISVMPNMEGIIAEFPEITRPPNWLDLKKPYKGKGLRMFVWTSEGVVEIDRDLVPIEIYASANGPPKTAPSK